MAAREDPAAPAVPSVHSSDETGTAMPLSQSTQQNTPPPYQEHVHEHYQPPPHRAQRPPSFRDNSDNESLLPSYAAASPWGRHRSEQDYLSALAAFVSEKEFMTPTNHRGVPTTLIGFYGQRTAADYIEQAQRDKEAARLWKRRHTVAVPDARQGEESGRDETITRKRRSSVKEWLRRR